MSDDENLRTMEKQLITEVANSVDRSIKSNRTAIIASIGAILAPLMTGVLSNIAMEYAAFLTADGIVGNGAALVRFVVAITGTIDTLVVVTLVVVAIICFFSKRMIDRKLLSIQKSLATRGISESVSSHIKLLISHVME